MEMEERDDEEEEKESQMLSLKLRTGAATKIAKSALCSRVGSVADTDINAAATKEMIMEEEEGGEELEEGENSKRSATKKMRLTLQQSAVLEDCFKYHTTLSPKKKVELAKTLNLKPRQIEVWFQNRRARTEVKQTEVDYEYFRQYCEVLTRENLRLQRALMQLYSLKPPPNLCMPVPATTLVVCSSCEREKVSDIPTAIL